MGVRFALTGGREAWTRTVLTAIGVGLGVSALLLAASVPNAMASRDMRGDARTDFTNSVDGPATDSTLLLRATDTTFREHDIRGRLIHPEGPRAPLPPGVAAFPGDGEMAVSPALRELLASPEGKPLRERIPYEIVAEIKPNGLVGPYEMTYYAGSDELDGAYGTDGHGMRLDGFGEPVEAEPIDPVLMLLVLIILVVLLMPVAVFIAASVRFGGDRRDRRLAALRLVGADSRATRRIAAGEAVAGALLGLAVGAGLFFAGRRLAGRVPVAEVSAFPEDFTPSPVLAALVVVAVPLAAVAVTLLALRGVVIEPLGVVRAAKPRKRRLLWRLLLPVGGLALLVPLIWSSGGGYYNTYMVVGGAVLMLLGVTALLPWAVEAVVGRLGRGPVAWQLAVRRLQLNGGAAAQTVNGIAVAVAGAIALQMLFSGVDDDYYVPTGQDLSVAQMEVLSPRSVPLAEVTRALDGTPGVRRTSGVGTVWVAHHPIDEEGGRIELTVGDCEALAKLAKLPSCRDGDVFRIASTTEAGKEAKRRATPGATLYANTVGTDVKADRARWELPATVRKAEQKNDPTGYEREGLLATPGAFPESLSPLLKSRVFVGLEPGHADAPENVRTAAAVLSPFTSTVEYSVTEVSNRFEKVRMALFVGAACVLLLIGASLLVSQTEQLRERRKLLAALVAFGTRRRTLAWSVLWQTAVPVGLALVLALGFGLLLGMVLLFVVQTPPAVPWAAVGAMTGAGAAVVLLVTALSMPVLMRLMRPEGLRTE
ncbi:FtsX-like permease family protein [Streptomyces sp. JNUCC 64]